MGDADEIDVFLTNVFPETPPSNEIPASGDEISSAVACSTGARTPLSDALLVETSLTSTSSKFGGGVFVGRSGKSEEQDIIGLLKMSFMQDQKNREVEKEEC